MTKIDEITATFTFLGADRPIENIPVLNPGGWFGKAWLLELGGSYSPLFLVVEADSVSDAIDELSDDETYGPQIHVAPEDEGDYDPEDCHRAGNDGRMVDLDWLSIHGAECTDTPLPGLRYHGPSLPADGIPPRELDGFQSCHAELFDAYRECALWSSNDESTPSGGEPFDRNYDESHFSPEANATMARDCAEFLARARETLRACESLDYAPDDTYEQAGHDFWLTRNGHGAGFWDGDWPKFEADRLDYIACSFGECHLYVGDDGAIHASVG